MEKQLQQKLNEEIESLKLQLEESRQGLQAASRLGDQLEFAKKQNIALKEEGIYYYNSRVFANRRMYTQFSLFVGPHMKYQLVILGV